MPKRKQRVRCDHCGRPIRNTWNTVTVDGLSWVFHGDRRTCRRAGHETHQTMRIDPPQHSDEVNPTVIGAALIGFDYVDLPWWLRWVPKAWLDQFGCEVAVKVGGIVERRIAVDAMRLEVSGD